MHRSRRIAAVSTVLALVAAAAVLAVFALDAGKGAEALRSILGPDDPDLAFADPFTTASAVATLALGGALVLGTLIVVAGRRILFGLTAVWSLLTLAGLALALAPLAGALRLWRVAPLAVPIESLDVLLAIACLVCLATSVLAWRVTPFGWDWLSEPVPRSPAITSPPHQS